jgi:mevalonate pyrophosphate decarboxylase
VSDTVTARAYSNIALCKYWGKLGPGNAPATPSLSLCLAALQVSVTVSPARGRRDQINLPAGLNNPAAKARVAAYLDFWRASKLISGSFSVESQANFPAGSGLASSAAAFAALAQALSAFAPAKVTQALLSRLARHGSGSASRSVTGGLSALPSGPDPAARSLAAAGGTLGHGGTRSAAHEVGCAKGWKPHVAVLRNWAALRLSRPPGQPTMGRSPGAESEGRGCDGRVMSP